MKRLLMAVLVMGMMFVLNGTAQAENISGLGVDVILFEQGDETSSNLNDITWLKSIEVEYRCDLNGNRPDNKVYLVGKIRLWNK